LILKKIQRSLLLLALLFFALSPVLLSLAQESTLTSKERTEILAQADSILDELRTLRGQPPPRPVHKEFKSKEQLRDLLWRYSQEEKNQQALEAERKTMLKFGLIPRDFPYVKFALDLLTEQVAGFYDFRSHELNLLDSVPMDLQVPVLAHELTHALQDQSFNLKKFSEPTPGNDDLTEAHHALVEGEATAMMLDFLLKPLGRSLNTLGFDFREMIDQTVKMSTANSKVFQQAPRALQTTLTSPYLYGTSFFQYFRRHNDWSRAGAIYRDPPPSMEQVMHPEKYFDRRDDPILVTFPTPKPEFLKHWKLVDSNVLGELGMLIVLQQFLNDDNARIASEGWAGDRYQLYEDEGGRLLLLLYSTWDTREDTVQFFNSYRVLLDQKYKRLKVVAAEERRLFRWDSEAEQVGLEIRDHEVIVIEGTPASEFESLRTWLWQSSRTRTESPQVVNDTR
jgi:hypothetical protein